MITDKKERIMKKTVLLFVCLLCSQAFFAQNEQKEGDTMAAAKNYQGAAMMYRVCMENNDQCALKLFKLIYDEKIDAQFSDELYLLIEPLSKKKNAEAHYYLGMLYRKGTGGVSHDNSEAKKWLESSAKQRNSKASSELKELKKEEAKLKKEQKQPKESKKKQKEPKESKKKQKEPKEKEEQTDSKKKSIKLPRLPKRK
jgi:hypothetical protein